MVLSKTKKTVYEVRYSIGGGLSMRLETYNTKAKAIKIATNANNKLLNNCLYYVKKVSTEIVFTIGKSIE